MGKIVVGKNLLFRDLQLMTVLFLMDDFYMSWKNKCRFSKRSCGIFHFWFGFVFNWSFPLCPIKNMDSLTSKSYNSFQNQNNRKVTHFVAPRSLIFNKNNKFITSWTSMFNEAAFQERLPPSSSQWWEKPLSKPSLIKHTFSWRINFLY